MTQQREICAKPVFFERNRVFRIYRGGKLFHDFFGDEDRDGDHPEEWVASQVKALNRDQSDPTEGLSFVEGTRITFRDLLRGNAEQLLGDTSAFDVLVKLLDSAIRLPVQVHPDRAFSEKYLHSEYGKTEMWLVLQTRPNACIYLGFREKTDRATFERLVDRGLTEKDAMVPYLNRIAVQAGDVYLIPARTVHAIGAGCLILEVQEPTDFTIQPEYWCGDYRTNEYEMYLGLGRERALECFDYDQYGETIVRKAKKEPRETLCTEDCRSEQLIGKEDTHCFRVDRHTIGGSLSLRAPSLYIVTDGKGALRGEEYAREIRKVDYFFVPACAAGKYSAVADGQLKLVECRAGE